MGQKSYSKERREGMDIIFNMEDFKEDVFKVGFCVSFVKICASGH